MGPANVIVLVGSQSTWRGNGPEIKWRGWWISGKTWWEYSSAAEGLIGDTEPEENWIKLGQAIELSRGT